MWFNILKLDLSQLSTQIQGDTQGENVNIEESNKCEEKIKRFEDNLYREFDNNVWGNSLSMTNDLRKRGTRKPKIPEKVFCWIVENLDKFFSSGYKKLKGRDGITVNQKDFLEFFENYSLELYTIQHQQGGRPFTFILIDLSIDKTVIVCSFNSTFGEKEVKDRYERVKSSWERA